MVQLKQVLHNFLPKKYKGAYNRQTTPATFKAAAMYNGGLGLFLLGINFLSLPSVLSKMTASWWQWLTGLEIVVVGSILLDIICGVLLRYTQSIHVERLIAIVAYVFGGFINTTSVFAFVCLLYSEPLEAFIYGMIVALISMMLVLLWHLVLVMIAIKKNDISFRDKNADYPINTLSILVLVTLFTFLIFGDRTNMLPFIIIFSLLMGVIYCLVFFQYPRVLRYWRQPAKPEAPEPVPHKNGIARIKKIR